MIPECSRCGVRLYYPNNVIDEESVCTNCFQKEKEKMFEDTEQIKETVSQDIKRDLKADLELCKEIRALDGFETDDFKEFVEVERIASEYAANVREGWPHAIERAIKAEALTQELVDVLDVVLSDDSVPMSEWLESKGQLKKIHSKAKEVLGDE